MDINYIALTIGVAVPVLTVSAFFWRMNSSVTKLQDTIDRLEKRLNESAKLQTAEHDQLSDKINSQGKELSEHFEKLFNVMLNQAKDAHKMHMQEHKEINNILVRLDAQIEERAKK